MNDYTVEWRIDISASSPEEAARQALAIQRDPESTAVMFDVYGSVTHSKVDLIGEGLNKYLESITIEIGTRMQEWFSDCETLDDAVKAITTRHPLPQGISVGELADHIRIHWERC